MEVDTLIIAAGCFVASALVIYLITKCTMQGETFEQVMEEKRRREAMFMSQPKKNAEGKKEKKKKQTKPKAQKKQKEEPVAPQEEIHKMVEIEPDPEIIEPPPEIKPIETPTKKMKSRLKNKNEHSLVREGNVTPELFHPSRTPMDDLEVKHERDRRRSHTEIVEKEVMEEVMKLEAAVQQAAPKSKKNKRKQQAAQPPAEPTPAAEEKPNAVVQSVMTASLTTVEIHTLIDVLHQKLGSTPPAPAQWTKKSQKPDQLAAITKQLEDSQAAHQEEKSRVQETASQLLKYRKEAEQEKSQLRSKQNALEEENTALRNRMQKSTQEHMEVSKQLHQARQQIEEVKKGGNKGQDNAALIQRLQAEIEKLRTERENAKSTGGLQQQIMQQQLESNALSLNAKDSEIRKLQDTKRDTETVLNRKVQELEAELQRSHSRLSNISRDAERLPRAEQELANLRNQMKNLEGAEDQMKSLRQQLQDEQRQKQELQAHNAKMEAHLREVEFGAQEKDQMVQTLQREKSQLANELKESKKVVSEEVVMVKEAALTSSAPPPAQQAEQEAALQRLQGELDSALTEKKRLAADLEAQRKKNNDLREKNWKAMDALSSMEKIAQKSTQLNSDLDTKDSVIRALKDDLHLAKRSLYDLQGSLELSQKSYSGMEKKNADLEAEKQQMNAELSQLAQLRSENETLIAETTQLTTQIEILKTESSSNSDDRIKELQSLLEQANAAKDGAEQAACEQLKQLQEELASRSEANEQLLKQLAELKAQLEKASSDSSSEKEQLEGLQKELSVAKKENADLAEEKARSEAAATQLQQSAAEQSSRLASQEGELEDMRQQLQSKIEALSQVENSVDDKVNKALLGEKEKMVAEGKEQAKRTLQKLFPEVDVTETIEESEWITVFEQKVHAFISQKEAAAGSSAETAAQLAEAEQCKNKLECQVEHYKAVLDDTESTLKKLESTIDSEQRKWAERTRVAEEEAAKLKQENQALQANSEMEDKLASMEKRLSSAEQERDTLQDQLNQSNEALGSLKSDLAKTHEDAASAVAKGGMPNGSVSSHEVDELKHKLDRMTRQLEQEQLANRQLTAKLNEPQDVIEPQIAVASAVPGLAASPMKQSPAKTSPPAKAPTTQQELEDSIAQYIVDEKPLQVQGTVTAKDSFSAKTDCEVLRKAMKGLGTDEKAIVSVMGHRTFAQRQELIQTYKTLFSKDLQKELKSESSGNFKNVLMGLCQSPTEFMADQLRKAMKGAGTDEDCLIEILCTLSNAEMKAVSEAYTTMHNRVLEKDLTSELSGGLRTLLLSLLQANRPEGSKVDLRLAAKDASELCAGGDKKTTETKFSSILVTRSYAQLRATFEEYKKVAKKDLADTIKAEFSGDVKKAMLAVVECIRDKTEHFARVLYESMAGAGTRDEALIRCVVLRSEVDMLQIKQKFEQKYKQPLGKMIVGDLSGPYKRLVLAMVGEEQYSKK